MLHARQLGALKWVLFIAVSPLLAKLIINNYSTRARWKSNDRLPTRRVAPS